jgi:hypothetical protein
MSLKVSFLSMKRELFSRKNKPEDIQTEIGPTTCIRHAEQHDIRNMVILHYFKLRNASMVNHISSIPTGKATLRTTLGAQIKK